MRSNSLEPLLGRRHLLCDRCRHTILVIRIRGALTDDETKSVDGALEQFSQKWAQTGAIFRRVRYNEVSFVPVGFAWHAELLKKLIDEQTRLEALLLRQARILESFGLPRASVRATNIRAPTATPWSQTNGGSA